MSRIKSLGLLAAAVAFAPAVAAAQTPTFTKDVASIFQEKCEACHRPDSIAPMSLVTYEEARPWAR
jgi:cytochrome c5